jgi:hypothetical protein
MTAELIRELGVFLDGLRKGKPVNALHREILSGVDNPLWTVLPRAARTARYQNGADFSEHWTAMRRGERLPKYDRLVVPAVVALSLDAASLRRDLATAEQLWQAADQASRAAREAGDGPTEPETATETGGTQVNVVAGQHNQAVFVQNGSVTLSGFHPDSI